MGFRYVSLAIFLFGFWLALSGHYTPLLVAFGALSALLCVYAAARIRIVDREGHPIELLPRALLYYPWLFWEILCSGWKVALIVLHRKRPISPTLTSVHPSQKTTAGLATYANSIMLTAGSIVGEIEGEEFVIYTLDRDSALELEGHEMDLRVRRIEGGV